MPSLRQGTFVDERQLGLAIETLRRSPKATRVLVEDGSATALP
jgi:hypothetical protein